MFKRFKNSKKAGNREYTDSELFQALHEDEVAVTEQDIQKANENDPETFYKIGDNYSKKENYEKAFAWFYKATLKNHPEAQARVGYMYELGQGVSIDYEQAIKWSMKAASAGNARGQYNIGLLYYCGDGVSVDYKQFFFFV